MRSLLCVLGSVFVPSDHSAHQNPQAIAAVLKILKDNAER
jgi:hypothetical protein